MQGPEKNSYKEFDNKKKFLQLENSPPPPPHNFSNGPSLNKLSLVDSVLLSTPLSFVIFYPLYVFYTYCG